MPATGERLITDLSYKGQFILTAVHVECCPSQQRRLQRWRPQERSSWHFCVQRNSWEQGISPVLAPHRHFFVTTIKQGGQGGGWQFTVQRWPQESSLSQHWWHDGVGSVQGIINAIDKIIHSYLLCLPQKHFRGGWLGHGGQGPSWQAKAHVWWPQLRDFPQIRPHE